jgi:hypothetical protein
VTAPSPSPQPPDAPAAPSSAGAAPGPDAGPAALRRALARLRARAATALGGDLAASWSLRFAAPADPDAPRRILAAGRAARPGALLRLDRAPDGAAAPALLWMEDGSPLARRLGVAPAGEPGWPPGPEERLAAAARLCDGVAMRLGLGRGAVRLDPPAVILPLRRRDGAGGGWSADAPPAPPGAPRSHAAARAAGLAGQGAPALVAALEDGVLVAALPPLARFDDFRELVFALDETAAALCAPVLLDGAPAPPDPQLRAAAVRVADGVLALGFAPAPPGAVAAPAGPAAALWAAAAAEAGPMRSAALSLGDPPGGPARLAARADAAARFVAALVARPGLAALLGDAGPRSLLALGPAQAAALDLALAVASQPRGAAPSARWRVLAQALDGADLRLADGPSGGALVWDGLAPLADPDSAACVEAAALALLGHGARDRAVARAPAWLGGPADRWLLPSALWPDAAGAFADSAPEAAAALVPWLRRAFDGRFAPLGAVEAAGLRLSARRAAAPGRGPLRVELLLEGPLADCAGLWVDGRAAPLRADPAGGGQLCGVVWEAEPGPGPADRRAQPSLAVAVAPEAGGPALLCARFEPEGEAGRLSAAPASASFGPWRPTPDPRQPATLDLRLPPRP